MSLQRLLDDICALDNQRGYVPDYDERAAFKAFEPPAPRPNFRKSLAAITAKLARNAKRGRKLAKATGSVWDRLTPTGDDRAVQRQKLDAFLNRCQAAFEAGEIDGQELIMIEGLVNRKRAGLGA